MSFTISGSLAIDETYGTQNPADSSDNSGNDVAGGLSTLVTNVPQFDALLAVVVGTGVEPTGVSVSNATADNSTGTPLLTALGSHVGDLAFTDSAGDSLDGDAAKYGTGADEFLRTTDGVKIFLYSYSGSDLPGVDENNVVFGRAGSWDAVAEDWVANPTGAIVFAAYLQPTDSLGAAQATDALAAGAKVWLVEYEPILHPVAGASVASHDDSVSLVDPLYVSVAHEDQFSLAGAPSGQNLFLMYGDGTPSAADTTIVVTGWHPADQSAGASITTGDTVNTGKGGGDTTIGSNNQMIDPNEGMYFTFVTGANTDYTVANLSQTEADVEANIDFTAYQGSMSASFDVVQLQPPKGATLKISAFDNTDATEKGTTYIDGLGDSDDSAVNVTEVTITRMVKTGKSVVETSYTFSEGSNTPQGGLTLDFTGDTVVITGVKTGDHIEYTTSALHNRVLINNVGNEDASLNSPFDIGGFSVGTNTIETTAFSALAFQDDGPSVAVSATDEAAVLMTTQDAQTKGSDSDTDTTTADFSGVFSNLPDYGADGAGTTVKSYELNLYGADGTDSLLDSNGVSILLYKVGDVIKGSTAASLGAITDGNTIFTIGVGTATGVVTLTQYAEIDHALESETGSPFDDQYAVLGAGLVKLTGSALTTDGDGDTDSDSQDVDLGGNVRFADDGPSVTVSATGEEAILLTTQDAQTKGSDSDTDTTTADFSGVFSNLPDYGADGAGSTVKSYELNLYGADGTDSLLDSNGVSILLYKVGDVIKGSTAASAAGITDGNTIFTIGVGTATGVVTLTQYAEIDHALESETGSPFDDQYAVLGANLVKLTGSALTTDGDGDTDSDSQDVDLGGNVRFADDGPSVTVSATGEEAILLTTQDAQTDGDPTDSDSDTTTADFSGVFSNTPVYGADGAGSTVKSYAVNLYGANGTDSLLDSDGASILLYKVGDVIKGSTAASLGAITDGNTIFTIGVGTATGVVTLTQYAEIDHALESETGSPFDDQYAVLGANLVKLTGSALTTDGDGDTDSDSQDVDLGGNVRFADDGPSVTVSATGEEAILLTTQDAQTDGDPTDSDSDTTTADFSGVFSNTPVYGADGAGSTVKSYAVNLYGANGTDSLLDSNGVSILLYKVGDVIKGSTAASLGAITDGNTIFTIGVGTATGVVTLTQYAEIDHALESETGSPFDDQYAVLGAGLVKLTESALTTDGDGDTDSDSQDVDLGGNVRFADDGPALSGVDDSSNSLVFDSSTAPFVDSFTFAPGADGAATPGVALVDYTDPDNAADLSASGLGALETLLGKDITASQSGNTVTYYTPDGADAGTDLDPLFTLVVTDSNWTFTILQDAPLVFNNFNFGMLAAGGPQETLSLAATNSTTFGVFDGFLFGDIDAADGTEARGINPPTPVNLPGSTVADTADDLNPDAHGFGVKGGAASNMNNNEGFSVSFHEGSPTGDDTTVEGLRFAMDQQGNTDDVVLSFQLTDSGTMPDIVAIEQGSTLSLLDSKSLADVDNGSFWVRMGLPSGNTDVFFTILGNQYKDFYAPEANELVVYVNGTYETAMFRMAYPDAGTYDQYPNQVGDSVRVKDVTLIETMPIPNVALEFGVQGTDGDGDTTAVETFDVFISEMGVPFTYPFV